MTVLDAIILGVVEGITEYLPISSTGHLIIVANLLGLDQTAQIKEAVDTYLIAIQGGAILAVVLLYWPRLLQMLNGLRGRDRNGLKLFINLAIAFLPAAIMGVLLASAIEYWLFRPVPVLLALGLGGVAMIIVSRWQKSHYRPAESDSDQAQNMFTELDALSWKQSLFIGLLQCGALWPGTSRSMMTILGGLFVGLRPRHAAEFSFLLGLPTLTGACVYKLFGHFYKPGPSLFETLGPIAVIVGFVAAGLSAALAIRWLVGYLNRHSFAIFGWYRIGLTLIMTGLILGGIITIEQPAEEAPFSPVAQGSTMTMPTPMTSRPNIMRSWRPGTLLANRAPKNAPKIEPPPAAGSAGQNTYPIAPGT